MKREHLAPKRILIVSSDFAPHVNGVAVYSTDLAIVLSTLVSEVEVLTSTPNHNGENLTLTYSLKNTDLEHSKISVTNISANFLHSKGFFSKLFREVFLFFSGLIKFKKSELNKFDLIISISPSLPLAMLGLIIAKRHKVSCVTIFQDLASKATLEAGIPYTKTLYPLVVGFERYLAKKSDSIVVISSKMKEVVRDWVGPDKKIDLILNYSILPPIKKDIDKARISIESFGNKFVVMYSGNFGYKQSLLNVVEAAKLLIEDKEILFVFIGDGSQASKLKLASRDLSNVIILPFVSTSLFPEYLAAANCLLVSERASVVSMSLPSKLTSYLIANRPVIACTSINSATSQFLGDVALKVEPDNPKKLAEAILKIKNDIRLRSDLVHKSQNFSTKILDKEVGRSTYISLVKEFLS